MKKLLLAATLLSTPAMAADLALMPYKATPGTYSPWFVYMGIETGGRVTNHSFDFFGTGTGNVEIGGALAGGLIGVEYKKEVMFRVELDADYDFGRGGISCIGMGIGCNITHGGLITERVDFGIPLAIFGGLTPFVSAGAQQFQDNSSVTMPVGGTSNTWQNAFLAGAGLDIPAGQVFSVGVRWDHVWPSQTITLNPVVPVIANTNQSDVFKLNFKWRL